MFSKIRFAGFPRLPKSFIERSPGPQHTWDQEVLLRLRGRGWYNMSFPMYLTRGSVVHGHALAFYAMSLSQHTLRKRYPAGMTHHRKFPKTGAIRHRDVWWERDCCPSSPTGYRAQAHRAVSATCVLPNWLPFQMPLFPLRVQVLAAYPFSSTVSAWTLFAVVNLISQALYFHLQDENTRMNYNIGYSSKHSKQNSNPLSATKVQYSFLTWNKSVSDSGFASENTI